MIAMLLLVTMAAVVTVGQMPADNEPCKATMMLRYEPNRLKTYSILELLSFFTEDSQEQNRGATEKYLDDVKREIIARRPVRELVCVLETSDSFPQMGYTSDLLSEVSDQTLDSRLMAVALADVSGRSWLTLMYFARRGDVWALERLNAGFYRYPVSSVAWAESVDLFGKYNYLPAARNMAKAVYSVSLNMVDACLRNLKLMFPDQHPPFAFSPTPEAREYWEKYVSQHTK